VAIGTDTGGSVRIPAACCGVTGLKTTFGRIPVDRVWPLAPSFDTVGPLARDVAGLELAMALLEPGFHAGARPAGIVGRIRTDADPVIEAAIDDALARSEFEVVELAVPALADVAENFAAIWFHEILASDQALLASDPRGVGSLCTRILERATAHPKDIAAARRALTRWREEFDSLFARVELLALATLNIFPPRLDELGEDPVALARELVRNTRPFNAVGAPASAQPIAVTNSGVPASLQLVGPLGSEELVLASAARVESALN